MGDRRSGRDNWVGVTVVMGLLAGLFGSLAAMLLSVVAGLRQGTWSRLRLPLMTFPAVLVVVVALEVFVFE